MAEATNPRSTTEESTTCNLDVAIIGGGIIGVMAALGLLHRGMRVTLYERAQEWHEMGVGFAFTGVARECMRRLNPSIVEALRCVGEESRHDFNRYWDGFHPQTRDDAENEESSLLFQVSARDAAYWGCLRSAFLRETAAQLPEGVSRFGKELVSCVDEEGSEKVVLTFSDGEVAAADILIGCDGINSTTRQFLLGPTNPASYPGFSHVVAYRTVLPVSEASSALGEDKATTPCMHLGPDAVNKGKVLNLSIFVYEPDDWPDAHKTTAPGTREQLQKALSNWGPHVRALVNLLPEEMVKWAIFDTADHPAPTYARGRICIAGDAAHATSPLLGAGACMGAEDALVLAETLKIALTSAEANKGKKISSALHAYSETRRERSQWLVQASREAGEIYQWRHPLAGRDSARARLSFPSVQGRSGISMLTRWLTVLRITAIV